MRLRRGHRGRTSEAEFTDRNDHTAGFPSRRATPFNAGKPADSRQFRQVGC